MKKYACLVAAALALWMAPAALAADKADFPSAGVVIGPVIRASENTPLNYMGGVPTPIVGALDADDSTYNRLVGNCGATSGVGTAVFFDTISVTNNTAGQADFVVTTSLVGGATCPDAAGVDTFLTAYVPSFNPAAPTTNCSTSNDDINGATNRCSTISFSIAPGGTAVIVVSSFDNGALFNYQVNFDGTTPVELLNFNIE